MTGEKKRLFENFISLGALQIISYVIPLVTLPYLSRVLSVANFGLVFFAFSFVQYFIMLTDYGFGLSATREIAVNRHNQNNLSNIFNSVMTIKFLLLVISFLILLVMIVCIPKLRSDWLVFVLSFFMVVGNTIYPVWFFQGMEHMKYITFLNILSKTIFLLLIFIFVKNDSNYILVPFLNALGFIISGLIGYYWAVNKFKLKLYIPKKKAIIKQFKYSSEFFLSRASVSLYTNTNTFFLGLISSTVMVGYYVAAEKIKTALNGIQTPLGTALYPYIAKNKNIKLFKKIFLIAIFVNICIITFIYIFASKFIVIFYGNDMYNAYKVLRIFCLVVFVSFPSILIGYPLLGALGHTKVCNISVMSGSVIHITGLFLLYLTGNMNIYTISFMVFITESMVLSIRLFFVHKYKLLTVKGEVYE